MNTGPFVLACVVIGGSVILQGWSVRRKRKRLLADRPQLSPDEFAKTYFAESDLRSEIAVKARTVLEAQLRCDLSGLRPEDRIAEDLYVNDADGMDVAELIMELEDAFAVEIPEDSQHIETFKDLVGRIEALTEQQGHSSPREPAR